MCRHSPAAADAATCCRTRHTHGTDRFRRADVNALPAAQQTSSSYQPNRPGCKDVPPFPFNCQAVPKQTPHSSCSPPVCCHDECVLQLLKVGIKSYQPAAAAAAATAKQSAAAMMAGQWATSAQLPPHLTAVTAMHAQKTQLLLGRQHDIVA